MARRRSRRVLTPWARRLTLRDEAPVKVGDVIEVTIEDFDYKGRGIGRIEQDYPVLVVGAESIGEIVRVRIDKSTKGFAVGTKID